MDKPLGASASAGEISVDYRWHLAGVGIRLLIEEPLIVKGIPFPAAADAWTGDLEV